MRTKEMEALADKVCKEELGQEPDNENMAFRKAMVHGMVKWDEYASQFQQEWIPVEVRLPDTTRTNFITAKDLSGRIIYLDHREHIWYHYGIGVWYSDIKMFKDKYPDLTIIAWQRIIEPQPYNPTKS